MSPNVWHSSHKAHTMHPSVSMGVPGPACPVVSGTSTPAPHRAVGEVSGLSFQVGTKCTIVVCLVVFLIADSFHFKAFGGSTNVCGVSHVSHVDHVSHDYGGRASNGTHT